MRRLEREAAAAAAAGTELRNGPFGPALPLILFAPPDKFPGRAAAFTLLHPAGTIDGRPVRFVAQSWAEYGAVRNGGPIARVLLPPTEAPE
jgi:hypothetical protein